MGTTAGQKKLFFNLRRIKSQIAALEEGDLRPENVKTIATKLGVTEDEVISMNRRMAAPDNSLNAPLRGDAEGDGEWQDWLVDDSADQETILAEQEELEERRELLTIAMENLDAREQRIITQRRLSEEPMTLEALSKEYNISRERVRQIEVASFDKLQRAMRAALQIKRKAHAEAATGLV